MLEFKKMTEDELRYYEKYDANLLKKAEAKMEIHLCALRKLGEESYLKGNDPKNNYYMRCSDHEEREEILDLLRRYRTRDYKQLAKHYYNESEYYPRW